MSKRITKAMAENAAEQLAQVAYDEKIENAKNAYRQVCNSLYEKYIPAPVRQCAEEYKEYYQEAWRLSFVVEGESGGRNYKSALEYHGVCVKDIVLSSEDWKVLDKADDSYRSLISERQSFVWDATDALVNLRTQRRVEESFPEALPYLNFAETTALARDLSKLRSMLH